MAYPSVDALQKALAETVFANRTDVKKAAGRALGTIVELITFYMLKQWGYLPHLTIERGLAEFGNDKITHNVEFGLHHCYAKNAHKVSNVDYKLPITASKIQKFFNVPKDIPGKSNTLLSSGFLLRNACVVAETVEVLYVAHLESYDANDTVISLSKLKTHPFAMVECKRVGVEEGAKKGPTTIEKAKQGAYVAKHVSSLQKVRGRDGVMYGVWPLRKGGFEVRDLQAERRRLLRN